jgi:hypothetical protein
MIMKSLSKLRDADDKFRTVVFAHDMTLGEKAGCKSLVEEAKKKETDDQ